MLTSFLYPLLAVVLSAQVSAQVNVGGTTRQKTWTPGVQTSCMSIPAEAVDNNSPSLELLAQAMNTNELLYGVDLQHLTIDSSVNELRGLKQSLYPAARGSNRTLFKIAVPTARTYQVKQKFYFEPGFDWGGVNEGGKLGFGLAGGSAPTGGTVADDGFTARFMWRGNGDGTARLVVYSYAADRFQNLPFGDDHILEGGTIPTGRWFEATFQVTTNSRPDLADGTLKAWFDGVPALVINDIQWQRAGADVVVDSVSYSSFYGGGDSSWSPEGQNYIRFSDVCWTRSIEGDSLNRY